MNNIISNRLYTIASMIEHGKIVYDVGCDHAYLDIYLTLNNSNTCYAIDIRKPVVQIAKKNIEKFNLNIPVLLNNGIDNIDIKNNSIVVIAGMGTRTILKILKDKFVDELLIQSNDDLPLLRQKLSNWGYKIIDEQIVFENKYFYILIKFIKGKSQYTKEELLLGPILMQHKNNVLYLQYLTYLIDKLDKMLVNVPDINYENKNRLLNNKNIILKYLNT